MGDKTQRIAICIIPQGCSRHNSPGRPHAVTDLVRANKGSGPVSIILLNENPLLTNFATCCAVARAFPTYALKRSPRVDYTVTVYVSQPGESAQNVTCVAATHLAQSIQLCQKLVGEGIINLYY